MDQDARRPSNPEPTNGAEALHKHFKKCFQSPYPNIFVLASVLMGLQEETYVTLRDQNRQRNQRAATVQRRERIDEICQMYRSGQLTRAQYVHQISFKFLPVQV